MKQPFLLEPDEYDTPGAIFVTTSTAVGFGVIMISLELAAVIVLLCMIYEALQ